MRGWDLPNRQNIGRNLPINYLFCPTSHKKLKIISQTLCTVADSGLKDKFYIKSMQVNKAKNVHH